MTIDEARKLVAMVVLACPNQGSKLTKQAIEDMIATWAWLLEDIDANEATAAAKRHLALSPWMPAPAEIRAIVSEAKHGRRRPGGDAWGDVLDAVHRFGVYRRPTFADSVVARAVAALGWTELCSSEHQASDRARFVELYDKLALYAAQEAALGELPGATRLEAPVPLAGLLSHLLPKGES